MCAMYYVLCTVYHREYYRKSCLASPEIRVRKREEEGRMHSLTTPYTPSSQLFVHSSSSSSQCSRATWDLGLRLIPVPSKRKRSTFNLDIITCSDYFTALMGKGHSLLTSPPGSHPIPSHLISISIPPTTSHIHIHIHIRTWPRLSVLVYLTHIHIPYPHPASLHAGDAGGILM